MSKEIIRFRGLSLNKDEQSAEHGELSLCAGVELHDGALRPSVLEGSSVTNALKVDVTVATLLYVHETALYRHFIGEIGGKVYWFTEDGTLGSPWDADASEYKAVHDFASDSIISINSVGNTLVVLADSGIHYILWKEGSYKYLGTQIPFLEIKFRNSETHTAGYDRSSITGFNPDIQSYYAWRNFPPSVGTYPSDILDPDDPKIIRPEHRDRVTEMVWALVNQANSTIAGDGHFYAPYFVRYCYRLYDGSMTMHSAPVLMNVASPRTYRVYVSSAGVRDSDGWIYVKDAETKVTDGDETVKVNGFTLHYAPNNVGLEYYTFDTEVVRSLKEDWSDIVKSIDIFVSPMLAKELQGEQIKRCIIADRNILWDARHIDEKKGAHLKEIYYYQTLIDEVQVGPTEKRIDYYPNRLMIDIPKLDDEQYLQKLKYTSTFYKLKSFDIEKDELVTFDFKELEYDKRIVANITTQEQMKDDYHSHNELSTSDNDRGMYIYNHRLNLFGMQEKLFKGFNPTQMVNNLSTGALYQDEPYPQKIWLDGWVVEIITENGKKLVGKFFNALGETPYSVREYALCKSLLFYPDSRASKMTIYYHDDDLYNSKSYKKELAMESHSFLNGSIVTSLFNETELNGTEIPEGYVYPTLDDTYPMPNKILTSEADNPYFFPVEGRNSVGSGVIRGIAAVTRALSQGQVGDHDLAVFSTDGIWVMKVSSEGTYMAAHNISREVCTNPKSICQLDQSVTFATERSMVRFVESDVLSMSEMLDGPVRDWSSLFGNFFADEADEPIRRMLAFGVSPVELFNSGRVFYDYASSRILVLPPDTSASSVAMVFSIRDNTWSTMPIPPIKAMVPGYPSLFMQDNNGKVTILNKTYGYRSDSAAIPGLILTRELTFSDTMDVIRGFRQYADSENAPFLFLFGSNDQRNWQAIGQTSRWFYNYMPGKPYRFFKAAIYMKMRPSEEYQQLLLEVVNKYAKL